MTDDLDPTRLLASAALDNEVTPDERAQVDASPSLTAEMATYATLRDHLGDVDVPAAARESAIDAALAVFDALQAGADTATDAATAAATAAALAPPPAPPPNANVVSLHARRQRQYRWVGGIAAAAIVAVVGIAVVNGPGGGDDKKSSATLPVLRTEANDSTAKAAATTVPSLVSAAQAPAPAVETGTIAASAADGAGGAQPSATTAAAAETTEAYATETIGGATETTEASDSAADTFDPWVGARAFNTTPDVKAYALSPDSPVAPPALESAETTAGTEATDTSSAATSAAATTVAATVPPFDTAPSGSLYPCDTGDLLVAPIYWQGARALLVRNDTIATFEVVSAATCAVLLTFPIP